MWQQKFYTALRRLFKGPKGVYSTDIRKMWSGESANLRRKPPRKALRRNREHHSARSSRKDSAVTLNCYKYLRECKEYYYLAMNINVLYIFSIFIIMSLLWAITSYDL